MEQPAATHEAQDVWERLYLSDSERLWRALLGFTRDAEIASDAMAEAFAQALRRGSAIRDPGAWVWRVAFRIAAGELKARGRRAPAEEGSYEDSHEGVFLLDQLQRLSAKQRGALVLHYYAGYRIREIARLLDSSVAAVKVHLFRGRHRLRQMMEEDDD